MDEETKQIKIGILRDKIEELRRKILYEQLGIIDKTYLQTLRDDIKAKAIELKEL